MAPLPYLPREPKLAGRKGAVQRQAVGCNRLHSVAGKPVCWQWWRSPTMPVIPAQPTGGNWVSPSCSMFSSPSVMLRGDGALLMVEGVIL